MNNKQRREIIENAKASGYDGSYVDLFRNSAAPLKLAVTEEERMKGLKPYNEPGGQAMALPNNPPNNPVNTIGARPPIRAKSVGSKVGSAPVAPGISSFKGVVTAGDLRARGKYGRRRAEEGTSRPPEASAAAARPDFANMGLPVTADDVQVPNVPVNGTPIKDYLDRAQIALGAGSLAAASTGVGEVISVPADLINAVISFGRAGYYGLKGDGTNASKYAGLGGLNVAAAIPVIGNAAGIASIAKTAKALGETKVVSQAAHAMHHGGEAAITAAKTADYIDLGDKAVQAMDSVPAGTFRGPKFKSGGYTNKFGRIKRSVGGPGGPESTLEQEGYTQIPGEEEGTMVNKWDAQYLGGTAVAQHDFNQRGRSIFDGSQRVKRMTAEKARQIAREDTMSFAVANYLGEMQNTSTGQMRTESDPRAAIHINKMFADVGQPNMNSVDDAWSAATVSHFAKQIDPSFKGSSLHAHYIRDAFQGNGKPEKGRTSGNYKARRINWKDDYEVGDILFRGREDTKGWSYKDFKNASKKGTEYPSHSDIIVGVGEDEKGKYYEILGGNMGGEKDAQGKGVDGTQHTKIVKKYASSIKGNYAGAMTTNRKKVKEERKEARKVLQETKRAKKKKAPKNAPKPNEPDLNLDSIEMEEENIPVFEWDKGNRRKRGGRLRDRRRKARRRK